jgi:uncharacterized membrane protein
MKNLNRTTAIMTLSLLPMLGLVGCQQERQVSYAQDVKPIIEKHCIECHVSGGAGYDASGFAVDTYEGLIRGTRNGPMIIAGDAEGSNMVVLMEGRADPSISMPHGKMQGATGKEIETIRLWIDQGAQNN